MSYYSGKKPHFVFFESKDIDPKIAVRENIYLKMLLEHYISLTELVNEYHARKMDHRKKSTAVHVQKIKECEEEIEFYTELLKTSTNCFLEEEN